MGFVFILSTDKRLVRLLMLAYMGFFAHLERKTLNIYRSKKCFGQKL
jgi:hypothetical protein